jgi:thioredoxin-like negative regulator of GroEL
VFVTLPTFIYEPVVITQPVITGAGFSTSASTVSTNDGWGLLADGNARDARRVFDRQMSASQNDGLAHIGYALSAALLERDDEAIAVMRLALRVDPEAIREVPQDQRVHDQIRIVLDRFLDRADQDPRDVDAHFMIAVLRFMMGDSTLSFFAIDRALDGGDADPAAQNLRLMIREAMEQSAPFVPQTTPSSPAEDSNTQPDAPSWQVPL